jgi:predicted DNA-binding protein (MmcQ/YjbR family)
VTLGALRDFCLAKKAVTEEFPFDAQTLVFKVAGKMFAATDVDLFESINLKVEPERGVELREKYPAVQPGYHMNKKHWITVAMDGSLPDTLVLALVDDSYRLVAMGLPKKWREMHRIAMDR